MMYYVVLLLIIVLRYFIKDSGKYCLVVSVLLVLFAGFRGTFVGPDTFQYKWIYEDVQRWHNADIGFFFMHNDDSEMSEPGYNLFQTVVGKFADYNVFKMLCAVVQIVPAVLLIRRYSNRKLMSLIIYYCLPVFSMMSMSMMRQGMAFGIFMLSYRFIIERKLCKYLAGVLCAFLFHTSALVLLPLYFLYEVPYRRRYIWLIFVGLGAVFLFSRSLYNFMISFARIEYEMSDSMEGFKMLIFLTICILCSLLVGEKKLNIPIIRFQLYLLVYTTMLWMVGMNLASVLRLAAYTEFFLCLYVPNLLGLMPNARLRRMTQIVACIVCVLIMQVIVLKPNRDAIRYVPYYFFWENRPVQ